MPPVMKETETKATASCHFTPAGRRDARRSYLALSSDLSFLEQRLDLSGSAGVY